MVDSEQKTVFSEFSDYPCLEKARGFFRIKKILFTDYCQLSTENRGDKMDDSMIVKRLLERDESVLSDVSLKYGRYCRTIARNILGNEQDAEEIVQDTLLRLWESAPPKRPQSLRAFIGKITRNLALDAVKSASAMKRGGCEMVLILEELGEVAAVGGGVEEAAEQREILAAVNDFLGKLPDNKRKILVLRYWHCFSISKIAQITDATEASVASVLKRERKRLLEYMSKRGY